jgi:dienelactone hydrolase
MRLPTERSRFLSWAQSLGVSAGVMANPSPGRRGDIRRLRRVALKVAGLSLPLALVRIAAAANEAAAIAHETVVIPSGALQLKAFLWRPKGTGPFPVVLFNHGSGSVDAAHTGPVAMTDAAEKLGPIFVKHGYAFLYLFRRGQGLSADQGPFMQDLLQSEEAARGKEASQHLQFVLMTTDHLDDVVAGLMFLKNLPSVDSHRIAMAGHSFGGQLFLVAAEAIAACVPRSLSAQRPRLGKTHPKSASACWLQCARRIAPLCSSMQRTTTRPYPAKSWLRSSRSWAGRIS